MRFRNCLVCAGTVLALTASSCFAYEAGDSITIKFHGYNSLEFGQVVNGENSVVGRLHNVWQELMRTGFSVNASVWGSRLTLNMNVQVQMWHSFPQFQKDPPTEQIYFNAFLPEANGIYKFGDVNNPFLSLGVGYFLYKYNPESRNLGEYLFRSTPYPQFLTSQFDFCYAQPMGIYLGSDLFNHSLKQDFFLTMNVTDIPIYDFSLAYVVSCNFMHLLEVGAGVRFVDLISMNDSLTTPKSRSENEYVMNGDTGFFSFKGTMLMGRATLDPKFFFHSSILGNEDLKLYCEAAILGVENQGPLFNDINKRIPVMFGFNMPTFNFMDVLAVEAEWFDSPYPNDNYEVIRNNYPQPDVYAGASGIDSAKLNYYPNGRWKWSVYGKKTINKNLSLIAQVANDHMRLNCADWAMQDYEETLRKPWDWYYMLKIMLEI